MTAPTGLINWINLQYYAAVSDIFNLVGNLLNLYNNEKIEFIVVKRKAMNEVVVGIVMGSKSDWPTMEHAARMLDRLGVGYETKVVSAHRTPDLLFDYASLAKQRGLQVIIAGAGGAAHLPGMLAAKTELPILGVPVESKALKGMDSLLSIVQMPAGIAVGTLAIGNAGAGNAGLLAAQIIALQSPTVAKALLDFRSQQTQTVLDNPNPEPTKDKPE